MEKGTDFRGGKRKRGSPPPRTSKNKVSSRSSGTSKQKSSSHSSGIPIKASRGLVQVQITRYLSKPLPSAFEDENNSSSSESSGDSLHDKESIHEFYEIEEGGNKEHDKENLTKFRELVNNRLSEADVTSIFEKVNGDVSLALDICCYYFVDNFGKIEELANTHGVLLKGFLPKNTLATFLVLSQKQPSQDVSTSNLLLPLDKYSPIKHAPWEKDLPAPYLHIAEAFDLIEKRGKVQAKLLLCNMFRSLLSLSSKNVVAAICLCTNKISPDHLNKMTKYFSLSRKILFKKPSYYQTDEVPDTWFSPECVWKIKGADFEFSPVHRAAIGLCIHFVASHLDSPNSFVSYLIEEQKIVAETSDVVHMLRSQKPKFNVPTS